MHTHPHHARSTPPPRDTGSDPGLIYRTGWYRPHGRGGRAYRAEVGRDCCWVERDDGEAITVSHGDVRLTLAAELENAGSHLAAACLRHDVEVSR